MLSSRQDIQRDGAQLIGVVACAVGCAWFLTDLRTAATTAGMYAAFALPGIVLLSLNRVRLLSAIGWGVPLGFSLTGLTFLVTIGLSGWNFTLLVVAYAAIFAVISLKGMRGSMFLQQLEGSPEERPAGATTSMLVPASIAITCLLVSVPLSRMGASTDNGHAFSGLFGLDFLVRSVHALSIAQTGVPPDNYYFSGEKITNYYLLWYLLPAMAHRVLGESVSAVRILSVMCLYNVPFFLLLLYQTLSGLIRKVSPEKTFDSAKLAVVFLLMLFCSSYHWLFFGLKFLARHLGVERLSSLSPHMGWMSQSWNRIFLFEPQVVMALMMAMLLCGLLAISPGVGRGLLVGVVLSALAMTDVWTFMIFCASYYAYSAMKAVPADGTGMVLDLSLTTITGILFATLYYLLGIVGVQESSNALRIGVNKLVFVTLPLLLVLNYGGSAVAVAYGLGKRYLGKDYQFLKYVLLISVLFMVCVTESLEGNVVLRKATYLAGIPVSLLAGCALYRARMTRWFPVLLVVMILGIPTLGTDLYATAGIHNGDYTTYVEADVMRGAQWIKKNTPVDSTVQSAVDYPGNYDYSWTIDFGERKSSLGFWKMALLFYPNKNEIQERLAKINEIFTTEETVQRLGNLKELAIDYVVIGKREREVYPGCEEKFLKDGKYFPLVFRSGSVSIFQIHVPR